MKKIQVIPYKKTITGLKFLLLKRAEPGEIWQGVTGKVEDEDKTIHDAVAREIREELSHDPDAKHIYGPFFEFSFITDRVGHEGEKTIEYCYSYEVPENFFFKLSREHDAFEWLPTDKAVERIKYDTSKKLVRVIDAKN